MTTERVKLSLATGLHRITAVAFGIDSLEPPVYYLYVKRDQPAEYRYRRLLLSRTANLLAVEVVAARCPLGVILDRLEENPEECEAPPDLLRAVVEWMRAKYPIGT
jgi:hypothetical protein